MVMCRNASRFMTKDDRDFNVSLNRTYDKKYASIKHVLYSNIRYYYFYLMPR